MNILYYYIAITIAPITTASQHCYSSYQFYTAITILLTVTAAAAIITSVLLLLLFTYCLPTVFCRHNHRSQTPKKKKERKEQINKRKQKRKIERTNEKIRGTLVHFGRHDFLQFFILYSPLTFYSVMRCLPPLPSTTLRLATFYWVLSGQKLCRYVQFRVAHAKT